MNFSILYPTLLLIPAAIMHFALKFHDRADAAKARELPVGDDEKFLRAPGESALKMKSEFDEKILLSLFFILATPPIVLVAFLSGPHSFKSPLSVWILWAVVFGIYAYYYVLAVRDYGRLYKQRQKWYLGFRGERAVGEYLNKLMLDGCRVFHDFPLYGKGNLDHIVVAPSGVYAVETKTRRKSSRLEQNYKVIYDGKTLEFPDWSDTGKLAQARQQASRLGGILYDQLKISVEVQPVLTLPGWFIERRGLGDVHVLNPKQIRSAIVETKPILPSDQIQKIAAYLDRECRDVAF